ncbi:MAG TPA: hypothetical protein VGX96_18635 [Candidatus Elarobacter sp.]|nr:hypothetical protein [Candidatus Elarobacter sp.]
MRENTGDDARALCDEDEILAAVSRDQLPVERGFAPGTLHRLPPIYFVGDSRALPFRNAVYTSEFTARSYQLRTVHLRFLHAADFYSRERGLTTALLDALATDDTLTPHDEGARWTASRWEHDLEGAAPLVLFCGPYDAHRVMDYIGPDADIAAWDQRSHACDVSAEPASRLVSAAEVRRYVLEIMEPFALGIEALRAMGLDRIFVHGSPAAPQRTDRFYRLFGHVKWLRQYHPNALSKVLLLFDDAARTIAARTSARYLSGPVDAHGGTPPELTSDDVHYNADGVRELARSVVAVLEGVVE